MNNKKKSEKRRDIEIEKKKKKKRTYHINHFVHKGTKKGQHDNKSLLFEKIKIRKDKRIR